VWQAYRCWLSLLVVWAVGGMKQWHCCISYLIQVPICTVCKHKIQKHFWSLPPTRIFIDIRDSLLLPLLFLRSLSTLSDCHIINMHPCHQDIKLSWIGPNTYIIHILSLIIPNFLPNCVMNMAALSIFQAWVWVEVAIGMFLLWPMC
jgi:hypothetical protein